MTLSTEQTQRLPVSRHIQDFNGYCGPACALMVIEFAGSSKSPPVFAQNELFKEVRAHAKQHNDRRPVKSPAESLLSILNEHTAGDATWKKSFNPESEQIAREITHALQESQQPCLMLVSKGMHWVVAFGLQKKEDGSPAGILVRDPAWAGMPKFYGLSIFPEQPVINHTSSPCSCLDHTDNPPGTVHERFITMQEIISHRGLQGSPDWEGHGAIALIPANSSNDNLPSLAVTATSATAITNPAEQAGQAALDHMRNHGLHGRPDSPPEWNAALNEARAGEPILVKDPDDPRDDFFLVPLIPKDPNAKRGAWVVLDTQTLELREASLLDNWKALAFPDENSDDTQKASQQQLVLPDGTVARFKKEKLTPNKKNLVWKASAASILPYWPLKELTAPHPQTGEPASIYLTQDGKVYTQLLPDDADTSAVKPNSRHPPKTPPQASLYPPAPKPSSNASKIAAITLGITSLALLAATTYFALKSNSDAPILRQELARKNSQIDDQNSQIKQLISHAGKSTLESNEMVNSIATLKREREKDSDEIQSLRQTITTLNNTNNHLTKQLKNQQNISLELSKKEQLTTSAITDLEKALNTITEKYTKIQKTSEVDKAKITELTRTISDQSAEMIRLNKEISIWRRMAENNGKDTKRLNDEIQRLQQDQKHLLKQILNWETQYKRLQTKHKQDLAKLISLQREITRLNQLISKLLKRKPKQPTP